MQAMTAPPGLEHNPFVVFTFLVAPAILTNASTLLTLSTSNRLARSVDRMRLIAAVLVSEDGARPPGAQPSLTRELAREQFGPSNRRCRSLIRALRACYTSIGCFAAATCVAMLGATLSFFGYMSTANGSVVAMLVLAGIGMLSITYAAVNLVRETTSTLDLISAEARAAERQVKGA
jgi:hypothetical protein